MTRKKALVKYMKTLKNAGKLEGDRAIHKALEKIEIDTGENSVDMKAIQGLRRGSSFRFMDALSHSETHEILRGVYRILFNLFDFLARKKPTYQI